MLTIELTNYEAVILEATIRQSYLDHRAAIPETPLLLRPMLEDHVEASRSAHVKLLAVLRAAGHVMLGRDLPAD